MRKIIGIAILLSALPFGALSQNGENAKTGPQVTLSANMMDVRTVINTIFAQAKKNYVLENGVMGSLNLSLNEIPFDEALQIVLKQSNLKFELENDIYFISKIKTAPAQAPAKPVKATTVAPSAPAKPKGQIPITDLNKKVTTRLSKTDIKLVFAELGKQTGIAFEIGSKVPSYKVDAFLINTSLKFALETITRAAGLEYKLTDNQTILITKQADPNHVQLSAGTEKD